MTKTLKVMELSKKLDVMTLKTIKSTLFCPITSGEPLQAVRVSHLAEREFFILRFSLYKLINYLCYVTLIAAFGKFAHCIHSTH